MVRGQTWAYTGFLRKGLEAGIGVRLLQKLGGQGSSV